jgi:hypothetical protein
MNMKPTRRHFLGGAVAAGTVALLPTQAGATPIAAGVSDKAASVATDTAITDLTHAAVAKVQWKAKPFAAQLLERHDGAGSQLSVLSAERPACV